MRFASALRVTLLTLTFAVLGAAPIPTTHYSVTMTQRDAGAGAERGTLDLRIPSTGIVTGTYRDFDGAPHQVSGGRNGDLIWLDYRNVRVTATVGPSGLMGRAYRGGDSDEYVFRAIPTP
jgi:hypothetical protein